MDLPALAPANTVHAVASGMGECTALKIRKLARRVTQIYDDALAPYGLTVGQLGLLASLRRSEGVGVGCIADRLGADASTVSRLLKPLEATGLIAIVTDPGDRRAKAVTLTDTGYERRRAAKQGWHEAQARVETHLGESRLSALRFMLDDAHSRL